LAAGLRKQGSAADITVIEDISKAGGGSLPEASFDTYAVSIVPSRISVNDLEKRLRSGSRPVIARIRENAFCSMPAPYGTAKYSPGGNSFSSPVCSLTDVPLTACSLNQMIQATADVLPHAVTE